MFRRPSTLLRRWFAPAKPQRPARPRKTVLTVESLETRLVPATIHVTSLADGSGSGPAGSLRAAITSASNGDTIDFTGAAAAGTLNLVTQITISKSLIIQGPGADALTIANKNSRLFHVTAVTTVNVSGLNLSNAIAGTALSGGAVYNDGTMAFSACTFSGDAAADSGGALENANGATMTVTNCAFDHDLALSGNGDAIDNAGSLTLNSSTFYNNSVRNTGSLSGDGNTFHFEVTTLADSGRGSLRQALTAADVGGSTTSTTIHFADAAASGTIQLESALPDIQTNLTLQGPGADRLTISRDGAAAPFRLFHVLTNETVVVSGLTLIGGSVATLGGAIHNQGFLSLDACNLLSNGAANGGALFNAAGATAAVTNCFLYSNSAQIGGGICSAGTLTVTNSTFVGNGATINGGGLDSQGTTTVTDGTFTQNRAASTGGAGVGGGIHVSGGTLALNSTLVAGNFRDIATAPDDLNGTVAAASAYNLIGMGTGLTGISDGDAHHNLVGVDGSPFDARLGNIGSYGGTTLTMPLLPNSPALGNGDPTQTLAADQRGRPRKVSGRADVGAYQVQPVQFGIAIDVSPASNVVVDTSVVLTAVVTGATTADGTLTYRWFVGDPFSPPPNSAQVNTSFHTARTYLIILTVSNQAGDFTTVTRTLTVIGTATDVTPPAGLLTAAELFTHSDEHYEQFIMGAYHSYLGRPASSGEIKLWLGALLGGLSDEQMEAGFIGAPEYIANHGGAGAGWIRGMYQDLLGRTPGQSEVDLWTNALANGLTPTQVALGFAAGAEREALRVQANYQTYLGRQASSQEVDAWVRAFTTGQMTNEEMAADFVASPEYFNNPLKGKGTDADWVASVYLDVLYRTANQSEIDAWAASLG